MEVEENAFILSQIATNFFVKTRALGQLFESHFGKCKNLTFNRWQKIERKHEIDESRRGDLYKNNFRPYSISQLAMCKKYHCRKT